ncbi:MAG: hypothetical protein WAM42_07505 [Candidatus Nitrosopolaris sp.]
MLCNNMQYHLSDRPTTSANKFKTENQTSLCDHDNVDFSQVGQTTLRCTAESKNNCIEIPTQIHFILCERCYWCATFFNIKSPLDKCPSCNSIRIDSIPVSNNEVGKFRYDALRGVTREFSMREGT